MQHDAGVKHAAGCSGSHLEVFQIYLETGSQQWPPLTCELPRNLGEHGSLEEQGLVAGMFRRSNSPVCKVLRAAVQRRGCSRISEGLLQRAMRWSSSKIWTTRLPWPKAIPITRSAIYSLHHHCSTSALMYLARICSSVPMKQ